MAFSFRVSIRDSIITDGLGTRKGSGGFTTQGGRLWNPLLATTRAVPTHSVGMPGQIRKRKQNAPAAFLPERGASPGSVQEKLLH